MALTEDKVRGLDNYDTVHNFAPTLSVAPRMFSMFRDDRHWVVFCFAKPEDADGFCQRFRIRADLISSCFKERHPVFLTGLLVLIRTDSHFSSHGIPNGLLGMSSACGSLCGDEHRARTSVLRPGLGRGPRSFHVVPALERRPCRFEASESAAIGLLMNTGCGPHVAWSFANAGEIVTQSQCEHKREP